MENHQYTQRIVISEFLIKLHSEYVIDLDEGYEPFLATDEAAQADFTVECFAGMPDAPFANDELVFEAQNENQKFYSIYRVGNGLGFLIYDQQQIGNIQQVAMLDETLTQWKIYSEPTAPSTISPMKYPMGPILMHYMVLKTNSIMMHASCTFDGEKSRLFTGFSGNGKSTISKLWEDAGNLIINDDRIIIRKLDDGYYAYNTPMYYKDQSKKAPLSAIYLISHSPENRIKQLSGAAAISRVMAFSIQNNFEKQFIQARLNFFTDMCLTLPVYDLGFVPNQSVVKFVLDNEAGRTK